MKQFNSVNIYFIFVAFTVKYYIICNDFNLKNYSLSIFKANYFPNFTSPVEQHICAFFDDVI